TPTDRVCPPACFYTRAHRYERGRRFRVEFEVTIEIDAPPERVWAVMSDVERWHEWTASITSVELIDAEALAPGVRARVKQPRLPRAVWKVTSLDPGHSFEWETRNP